MAPLDDLLIKRRRGTLAAAERRRLDSARRASPEFDLVLLAHDVFERDGSPQPGDDERLRELALAVERAALPPRAAPRWRKLLRRIAPPLLFAGAAAASIGELMLPRPPAAPSAATPVPHAAPSLAPAAPHPAQLEPSPAELSPLGLRRDATRPDVSHSEVSRPEAPHSGAPRSKALRSEALHSEAPHSDASHADVSRSEASHAEAPRSEAPRSEAARPSLRSGPSPASVTRPPVPPSAVAAQTVVTASNAESAQSLFRRAKRLRPVDWPAAAELYAELIRRHPNSNEAGVSEVALGKWSLAQGRSGDALEWFRAHLRRPPGALTAEALFGEARALESIGSHAAARAPWRQLLERYPASLYAEVARQRLSP
jgi:TolA-binding protein